jgi:hypothetical protein
VIILYHGFAMKALDPALLSQAVIIREPGDDAPAAQASVPVQMPLMALPEHVLKSPGVRVRGHAAIPGTGPKGETCGSCGGMRIRSGAKNYTKCGLTQSKWTGGAATDVRRKDPACSKWIRRFGTC